MLEPSCNIEKSVAINCVREGLHLGASKTKNSTTRTYLRLHIDKSMNQAANQKLLLLRAGFCRPRHTCILEWWGSCMRSMRDRYNKVPQPTVLWSLPSKHNPSNPYITVGGSQIAPQTDWLEVVKEERENAISSIRSLSLECKANMQWFMRLLLWSVYMPSLISKNLSDTLLYPSFPFRILPVPNSGTAQCLRVYARA